MSTVYEAIRFYGHDEDFIPRQPCQPTDAKPGSIGKVQVMRHRVEQGMPVFCSGDETIPASYEETRALAEYVIRFAKGKVR